MRNRNAAVGALVGAIVLTAAWAARGYAHGPQLQITNDGNRITTRSLFYDERYNTYPAPASAEVQVYVMPLGPTNAFGGTEWYTRPNGSMNSGPGIAYGYGWTYTDASNYTVTFPVGARFRQAMLGELRQWNGSVFVDAGDAQLHMFRGSGASLDESVSGSGDTTITYTAITAPGAPDPDPHGSASYNVLGDGIPDSASHVPAPVADGIYMMRFQLELIDQPIGSSIDVSNEYRFVMFKGVAEADALAAAQLAFPGAGIQLVPEPAAGVVCCLAGWVMMLRSRG